MALLFLEEDPWLLEYESCEKLCRDIMEQLTFRQKHQRTSDKYSQLSASIRLRLKQFNNEVGQLNQKLEVTTRSGNMYYLLYCRYTNWERNCLTEYRLFPRAADKQTPAESERRTRQIETLHSKAIQMKKIFDNQTSNRFKEDRTQLVGMAGTSEWGDTTDLKTTDSYASAGELRAGQKKMLQEQEKGLENLSDIISRQKNIAHTISNEVDFHNEILDDLGNQVDRTDHRVRTETRHIDIVDSKDKTCIYWVIIILLLISIVVVAAI